MVSGGGVWKSGRGVIQATVSEAAGSVYFVRFGRGLAGWEGTSCSGAGVNSSAILECAGLAE